MNASPGRKPATDDVAGRRDHGVPAALLQRATAGDRQAIADVIGFVRPLVERYCRARLAARPGEADVVVDDVVQEVCLAILTALPTLRGRDQPFLAFVYGIASRKVVEAHRAAARSPSIPFAEVPDTTDRLAHLLDSLPTGQREILVLRIVAGMSAEETAEAVGTTPGAVRVAQHRALARLRRGNADVVELLAELDEEPLRLSYRSYVGALAATLDLKAGLTHLEDRRAHREFVQGIAGQLNLDAGLNALLRGTQPPDR
jgi:RNA polymerase sigma-70 factor (ECF subfamily)